MSRSTTSKTQLCPSQRNYSLTAFLKLLFMFTEAVSTLRSDACGGEPAEENLYHMQQWMALLAGLRVSPALPLCYFQTSLLPSKPKLYFSPREQRCPVATKLVMIGLGPVARTPSQLDAEQIQHQREGQWKLKGDPASHLRR